MRTFLAVFTFAVLLAPSLQAERILRSAAEIKEFLSGDAQTKAPLCATGIVEKAFSPKLGILSDATGRYEVQHFPESAVVGVGEKIAVTGTVFLTAALNPWIHVDSFVRLGKGTPTSRLSIVLDDLDPREHDLRHITTEGTVIDIQPDAIDTKNFFLTLRGKQATLSVSCSDLPKTDIPKLIDAHIRITGYYHAEVQTKRPFAGPILQILSPADIQVVSSPPSDPFAHPRLRKLRHLSPSDVVQLGKRVVSGTVCATWRDGNVLIWSDYREFVRCHLLHGQVSPPIGARIEAVGHPETDLFRINLSQVLWRLDPHARSNAAAPSDIPVDVSVADICSDGKTRAVFDPDNFGRLIRIKGSVRNLSTQGDVTHTMTIESDGRLVSVNAGPCDSAFDGMQIGATVRVSGVCILENLPWRPNAIIPQIKDFFLVVRTPQDIEVVSHPSWWTPLRLWILVGILFLALIAAFSVAVFLRRLVDRRGRELMREQLAHYAAKLRVGERTRLAVELHDTLSQNLSGVGLQISAAKGAKALGAEAMAERLATAERMLQSSRMELKRCLFDLRSDALGKADFADAISDTLKPILGAARLTLRFNIPRAKLHDTTAHAVICIIRELASNAVQHGKATAVHVAGSLEDGTLLFSVKDNGTGFDPSASAGPLQGHFGLSGIRERTERLGGTFTIESTPGSGTYARVSVDVPATGATEGPCL